MVLPNLVLARHFRFQILSFSHIWQKERAVFVPDLVREIEGAQNFCFEKRGQKKGNAKLSLNELDSMLTKKAQKLLAMKNFRSHRRKLSTLKVSRTLADLAGRQQIEYDHIVEAYRYCDSPFHQLKNIFN